MISPVKFTSLMNFVTGKVRFIYFMMSIVWVGFIFAYSSSAPLYLIGYFWKPCNKLADRILCRGIRLLMELQPWFSANIRIDVPNAQTRTSGILLVSNHRSHLDAFILLSRVPGIRILSKKSIFYVPFLGVMMHLAKHIPTTRGRLDSFWKALEIIAKGLRKGDVIHVFPEMTRCSRGSAGTLEFATSFFSVAIQERVPVIPIVFKGTDWVWPKGISRIDAGYSITAHTLSQIDSRNYTDSKALRDEVQKRINEALL